MNHNNDKSVNLYGFIRGETIKLFPLRIENVDEYFSLYNALNIRKNLGIIYPIGINELKKQIEEDTNSLKDNIKMEIIPINENKPIGIAEILNIRYYDRIATINILISEDNWNKGIGTEASILLINYCFNELNIYKININIIETNEYAIKIVKSIGFKQDGRLKQQKYLAGKYFDVFQFSILNKEWTK